MPPAGTAWELTVSYSSVFSEVPKSHQRNRPVWRAERSWAQAGGEVPNQKTLDPAQGRR